MPGGVWGSGAPKETRVVPGPERDQGAGHAVWEEEEAQQEEEVQGHAMRPQFL